MLPFVLSINGHRRATDICQVRLLFNESARELCHDIEGVFNGTKVVPQVVKLASVGLQLYNMYIYIYYVFIYMIYVWYVIVMFAKLYIESILKNIGQLYRTYTNWIYKALNVRYLLHTIPPTNIHTENHRSLRLSFNLWQDLCWREGNTDNHGIWH